MENKNNETLSFIVRLKQRLKDVFARYGKKKDIPIEKKRLPRGHWDSEDQQEALEEIAHSVKLDPDVQGTERRVGGARKTKKHPGAK